MIKIGDILGLPPRQLTVLRMLSTSPDQPTAIWLAQGNDGRQWEVRPVEADRLTDADRERLGRLALLNHAGLLKVESHLDAQPAFVASEYVQGTSLQTFIDSRGLGVGDAVDVMRKLLLALDRAHEVGVVHGDLRADSVRVQSRVMSQGFADDGAIKLGGFDGLLTVADANVRTDLAACGELLRQMLVPHDTLDAGLVAFLGRITGPAERSFDSAGNAADTLERLSSDNRIRPRSAGPLASGSPGNLRCTKCQIDAPPGDNFCVRCGEQVVHHVRRCNACGGFPDGSDKCCTRCGSELPPPVTFARV